MLIFENKLFLHLHMVNFSFVMCLSSLALIRRAVIADISLVTQARALLELMVFWLIHMKGSIINLIMLLLKMGR